MILEDKKKAFVAVGDFLKQFSTIDFYKNDKVLNNELFYDSFSDLILFSVNHNGWFTTEQVITAINSWSEALTQEKIDQWISNYNFDHEPLKRVGLILAGNIPLVGFHDFISVLISGNKAVVKLSSNDQKLLPFLAEYLISICPEFSERIEFVEGKLEGFDVVIATGSNNTARYFDFYFKKYPSIIRKNRNSVAVLNGMESKEDLIALGKDIFTYFGLGCRNVSKLFVPKNYDFDTFFNAIFEYRDIVEYEKYSNNYDYNKAVFLMSGFNILDNGFMTLKEDVSFSSPISSVFYEFYDDVNEVEKRLELEGNNIQCVVSKNVLANSIPFGKTQHPELWDYADGIDTVDFLLHL